MVFYPPKTNPMEDEILDNQESSNLDAETGDTVDTTEETNEESNVEVDAELKKAKEYAQNQKIRAEKAEKALKAVQSKKVEEVAPKNTSDISYKDILSLADVHEDDREYLLEESKLRGKSISELKKDPYMQIILKTKNEERQTAQATNTTGARRGSSKQTDEQLIENFHKGIVPESDEGIRRLAEAQMNLKRAIAKGN